MNIHLKISSGFKGEKAKEEDFLIPLLSPRCGEGASCGGGVRQSCCCADPSISAHPAFGEVQ